MTSPQAEGRATVGPGTPLPWHNGWESTISHGSSDFAEIPLPSGWIESAWVGSNATAESEANARYIVTACNAFPELLEALEEVLRYRRGEGKYRFAGLPDLERECAMFDAWQEVEAKCDAALAKARGQS